MKAHTLKAEKRTQLGKGLKAVRKAGKVPASVYGKHISSMAVSIHREEFLKLHKEVGETGLIELMIDSAIHPVLVHHVQKDPVSAGLTHVEFLQVDLKEKVKAKVPLLIEGVAAAITQKTGSLLELLDEVEVEALPAELPDHIRVNVESLAAVDDEITVGNLSVPTGVTILTDASAVVVKIASMVAKEAEEQAAAEEASAAEAKAESEPAAPDAATPAVATPASSEKK